MAPQSPISSPPVVGWTQRVGPPPALGLVLALPAALLALATLVVPTGQTILDSFRRSTLISPGGDGGSAGWRNYDAVLQDGRFWTALGFSLSLAVIPLLVAIVVAPLLAAALDGAGSLPRRIGRVLMSVPLVVFSPVAVAIAWLQGMAPSGPHRNGVARTFGDNVTSAGTQRLVIGAATFGVVCGLALLGYLAALRGRAEGRRATSAMLVVGALIALTTIAFSLQAFSFTQFWGGSRSTQTVASLQYFRLAAAFQSGVAAVLATLTGAILGVLGIVATLIVIMSRTRLRVVPAESVPVRGRGTVIAVAALAVVMAVIVVTALPWLSALSTSASSPVRGAAISRIYVNTWVPPLLGAIVSVGAAYVGALGIGGMRPLGRHSEWLLLPFAPWLFVGVNPLIVADFAYARKHGLIDHFVTLVPPILISVPALVILTLFCRGQAERWRSQPAAGQGFLSAVAVPALPLAGLLAGAATLIYGHSALWPTFVGFSGRLMTAPLALRYLAFQSGPISIGLATPIFVVVVALIGLAALQFFYLDRVAIISGGPDEAATGGPSSPPYGPGAGPVYPPGQPYPSQYPPPPNAPYPPGVPYPPPGPPGPPYQPGQPYPPGPPYQPGQPYPPSPPYGQGQPPPAPPASPGG